MTAPARQLRLRIERHMILDRVVYSVRLGPESLESNVAHETFDSETVAVARVAALLGQERT